MIWTESSVIQTSIIIRHGKSWRTGWASILTKRSITVFAASAVWRVWNIILERADKTYTEQEKEAFATEKNEVYKELLKQMTPEELSPEVKDTLEELRNRGILLSIGSSSKNAGFILNRLGLGDFFDAVSDGNNISHSKPDPEVFLKAAEFLKLPASECLVVEDAEAGLLAAKNGGMDSAAIGDAVKSDLPQYKLETFSDLLNI